MRHLIEQLESLTERFDKPNKVARGKNARAEFFDERGGYIVIQELPGKPVKRRVRRIELGYELSTLAERQRGGHHYFLPINVFAKLRTGMSFDGMVDAVSDYVDEHEDKVVWDRDGNGKNREAINLLNSLMRRLDRPEQVSWLEIEPEDYEPIMFRGKGFGGTSEWGEFRFYADADDDEYMAHGEGMRAFYQQKSKGAARKLFKALKVKPDMTKGMTIREFESWLSKNKIGFTYVPTVWR